MSEKHAIAFVTVLLSTTYAIEAIIDGCDLWMAAFMFIFGGPITVGIVLVFIAILMVLLEQ